MVLYCLLKVYFLTDMMQHSGENCGIVARMHDVLFNRYRLYMISARFTVPLYTLIHNRSNRLERTRLYSGSSLGIDKAFLTIPAVSMKLILFMPEYFLRNTAWVLVPSIHECDWLVNGWLPPSRCIFLWFSCFLLSKNVDNRCTIQKPQISHAT